jgi:hypothetical protein
MYVDAAGSWHSNGALAAQYSAKGHWRFDKTAKGPRDADICAPY